MTAYWKTTIPHVMTHCFGDFLSFEYSIQLIFSLSIIKHIFKMHFWITLVILVVTSLRMRQKNLSFAISCHFYVTLSNRFSGVLICSLDIFSLKLRSCIKNESHILLWTKYLYPIFNMYLLLKEVFITYWWSVTVCLRNMMQHFLEGT